MELVHPVTGEISSEPLLSLELAADHLVPVIDLKTAGLVKVFYPRQSELWPEAA